MPIHSGCELAHTIRLDCLFPCFACPGVLALGPAAGAIAEVEMIIAFRNDFSPIKGSWANGPV